jgi:hypothetical protein
MALPLAARRARHGEVSTALALLSDRRLGELLDSARHLGTGIGGTTWLLEVAGGPVFVKRIALTDLERSRTTADVFGLPAWAHYGVGSAAGGAWRELASHVMTSNWALTGRCANFLLLHHSRVMARHSRTPVSRAEIDQNAAFWHDDPAIRLRLEALADVSTDLVLFLEYVPQNLVEWLAGTGDDHIAVVERDLLAMTRFLGAQGLQHCDAHFANILADGERLFLTDFGLALSSRFELSPAEVRFMREHTSHDGCYVVTHLVNWVASKLSDAGRRGWPHPLDRNEFVRRCAAGMAVPELPPTAAAAVRRYAPIAVVINDFYFKLHGESRKTPYPIDDIERACATTGFEPTPGRLKI